MNPLLRVRPALAVAIVALLVLAMAPPGASAAQQDGWLSISPGTLRRWSGAHLRGQHRPAGRPARPCRDQHGPERLHVDDARGRVPRLDQSRRELPVQVPRARHVQHPGARGVGSRGDPRPHPDRQVPGGRAPDRRRGPGGRAVPDHRRHETRRPRPPGSSRPGHQGPRRSRCSSVSRTTPGTPPTGRPSPRPRPTTVVGASSR